MSLPPFPYVESRYVHINGVKLHYQTSGNGPLLLMLHGFPEYGALWTDYLTALSDQFQVVAPDLRGYHLSEQPLNVDAYQVTTLARDVTALIEHLGAKQAFLVGHDWGGLLAWFVADYHPEYVAKLVTLNAPHPAIYRGLYETDPDQKEKAAYIGRLLTPGSEAALAQGDFAALQQSFFASSTHKFSDEERQGYLACWRRGLTGAINYYRSYIPNQDQYIAKLRGIKVPTLVLWGELDKAISLNNLVGLDKHVADLTIKRFSATHWLTYEVAPQIIAELRTFWTAKAKSTARAG